jgi:hypothetical protein
MWVFLKEDEVTQQWREMSSGVSETLHSIGGRL